MTTAADLHRAVWERFEGVVPVLDDEVDLTAIVMAVLDELQRLNFLVLEMPDD